MAKKMSTLKLMIILIVSFLILGLAVIGGNLIQQFNNDNVEPYIQENREKLNLEISDKFSDGQRLVYQFSEDKGVEITHRIGNVTEDSLIDKNLKFYRIYEEGLEEVNDMNINTIEGLIGNHKSHDGYLYYFDNLNTSYEFEIVEIPMDNEIDLNDGNWVMEEIEIQEDGTEKVISRDGEPVDENNEEHENKEDTKDNKDTKVEKDKDTKDKNKDIKKQQ